MENLILTSEQESSLILKGFTDLPQIKNEFISSEEIDHLIASKDKIYTSSTDFHKKYIDKNDIYTKLKKDLNELNINLKMVLMHRKVLKLIQTTSAHHQATVAMDLSLLAKTLKKSQLFTPSMNWHLILLTKFKVM